jgi:hypothetical protein
VIRKFINWLFPRWNSHKLDKFRSAKSDDFLEKYYEDQANPNEDDNARE